MEVTKKQRVLTALRLHPWRFGLTAFLSYSALWTVLEPITALVGIDVERGPTVYASLVVLSLLASLVLGARKADVSFPIRTTNTVLAIRFGDLFDAPGIKAIPVNEFFDTRLGTRVSPLTVHGQFVQRLFGGHPEGLEARLAEALSSISEAAIVQRDGGPARRYPIGTTALIEAGGERFLLTALAHTDIANDKAYATVEDLWQALAGLWYRAREVSNGEAVVVPLFGGGQSGVGLPPRHLLDILLLSLIAATKKAPVAPIVTVVLPTALFDAVDLQKIRKDWE